MDHDDDDDNDMLNFVANITPHEQIEEIIEIVVMFGVGFDMSLSDF